MMNRKSASLGRKFLALLICAMLLVGVLPMGNSVTGTAEGGSSGNLTFRISEDMLKQLPAGAKVVFTLYQIGKADPTADSGWKIDEPFEEDGILDATTTAALEEIAEKVYAKVMKDPNYSDHGTQVELDNTGVGKVTLGYGMYLGALTSAIEGLSCNPFIITVPTVIEGVVKTDYDVTTKMKYTPPQPESPPPPESPSPSPSGSPSPSPSESPSPSPYRSPI